MRFSLSGELKPVYARDGWQKGRRKHTCQDVLEADVEGSVGVRREDCPGLAGYVLWLSVLVANSIPNLIACQQPILRSKKKSQDSHLTGSDMLKGREGTYDNVQGLPVASVAAHNGRHNHERVLCHKVPYAPL